MSKNTLIIMPVYGSTISVPTIYFHKLTKKRYAINKNHRVMIGDQIKMDDLLVINMPPGAPHYEYEWESGNEQGEAIKDFWMNHELVKPIHCENRNMTQHLFDLKIPNEIDDAAYKRVKNMLSVANYVNDIADDEDELRNLSFFYNSNPTGKSKEKIFTELIDFKTGILMKEDIVNNFNKVYTKDNSDTVIKIVIRKAIAQNIIVYKDNRVYYFNNMPIGSDFDNLVMYCKENPEIYTQQIAAQVKRYDKAATNQVKDNAPVTKISENVKLYDLRDEAKSFKVRNYWNITAETCKTQIEAAKKITEEAEKLDIPWRDAQFKWIDEVQVAINKKLREMTKSAPLANQESL